MITPTQQNTMISAGVAVAAVGAYHFQETILDALTSAWAVPTACLAAVAGGGYYVVQRCKTPETFELLKAEDIEDADAYFDKALRCPDWVDGLEMMAKAAKVDAKRGDVEKMYEKISMMDERIAHYREVDPAHQNYPQRDYPLNDLFEFFLHKGEFEQAQATIDRMEYETHQLIFSMDLDAARSLN